MFEEREITVLLDQPRQMFRDELGDTEDRGSGNRADIGYSVLGQGSTES
jgi:hypothetical protein